MLLGLLLRIAGPVADLHAVDQHRGVENRMVRRILLVVTGAESDLVTVFLTPLDQPALEVGLRFGQLVKTQVSEINPVDEQPVHEFIALIEVDRADHGLESVAVDMFLRDAGAAVRNDVTVQPDIHGQHVERLAGDDFRPQLRKETLVPVGILDKKVVGGDRLDDGVSQKFEPLVVDSAAVLQNQRS